MKEIRIDGIIGQGKDEISAAMIREQLPTSGSEPVRISLHSEGGSVFEGFAIHDVLAAYAGPKTVAVESTAFSIASFIAMAGDEIEMSPNAYLMLHNPRISMEGDDSELQKTAGEMAALKSNMVNAYAARCHKSPDDIQQILKDETYFNATDAVAFGLADRISQKPITGRPLACLATMPHGVVSALYGAGSGGDTNDSKKGQKMTESTPGAATIDEIETAFPKLKPATILACLKKKAPIASVAQAAVEEMMTENAALQSRVKALEEELAAAKAGMPEEEAPEEEPKPEEANAEEPPVEKKEEAKAKARGVKPVAKATTGKPSASVRWTNAVEESLPKCGGNKMKAVAMANRNNPGLREAYLAEFNAR